VDFDIKIILPLWRRWRIPGKKRKIGQVISSSERISYFHVQRGEDLIKRADKLANRAIDEFTKFKIAGGKEEKEMDKEDAMAYYKKGKEFFFAYKHDLSPERVKEIESLFRKAIQLNPTLWAPHYYSILLNHALIEWLENALRELIQEVLSRKYGEDWWWEGVDLNTRKGCAERKQEARLKEERKLSELLFIDFHTYAEIIEKKKKVFTSIIGKTDLDELINRLKTLIPIRNAIMHCRSQYLSEETISKLEESCIELQKSIEKVRKVPFRNGNVNNKD